MDSARNAEIREALIQALPYIMTILSLGAALSCLISALHYQSLLAFNHALIGIVLSGIAIIAASINKAKALWLWFTAIAYIVSLW